MAVKSCGTFSAIYLGSLLLSSIGLGALSSSAIAYDVTLEPSNPRLGDTISVEVRAEQATSTQPPQVRVGDKTYPSFAVPSSGLPKFRALIPTSPLDPSGRLVVQVSGQEKLCQGQVLLWVRKQ